MVGDMGFYKSAKSTKSYNIIFVYIFKQPAYQAGRHFCLQWSVYPTIEYAYQCSHVVKVIKLLTLHNTKAAKIRVYGGRKVIMQAGPPIEHA